jgi:hypothetical protein
LGGAGALANARFKVGAEITAQLVWILAPRLPEPDDIARSAVGSPCHHALHHDRGALGGVE